MKKLAVITGFIGVVALIASPELFADEAEAAAPPPLTDVWIVVPKVGMEVQFQEAVAAEAKVRTELGDTYGWSAFTVVIGYTMNAVQFRACCFNWADLDAYRDESDEKGYGDYWNENVEQYIDHYHRYIDFTDWENSNWSEGDNDGPYYGATTWTVKQGAGPASNAARKKMSQLAINGDWEGEWLWLSRIGGKPMTSVVSSFENYADMAPPEQDFFEFMVEELGAEEAGAMFADFASGYTGSDYTVWKLHPGMSDPGDDE